jgi:hypothetical protein
LKKPAINTVPEWYQGYVKALPELNLLDTLSFTHDTFIEILEGVSNKAAELSYAPGKWSIKDLIQHVTDAERIFSYRALRFARKDKVVLSSYDHNQYVEVACANARSKDDLIKEYSAVRASTLALFTTFSDHELNYLGNVDDNVFSPLTLGFIIGGHQLHHVNIIQTRYLPLLQ